MSSLVFEKSVFLPASPEAVFEFHNNPHNMLKIMPDLGMIRVKNAMETARVGETFEIEVGFFLFTLRWKGVWQEVTSPTLLADGVVQGPMRHFRHEHRFSPENGGTRMTDHLELVPKLLPKSLTRILLPPFLSLMFAFRHRATKNWFQQQVSPEFS